MTVREEWFALGFGCASLLWGALSRLRARAAARLSAAEASVLGQLSAGPRPGREIRTELRGARYPLLARMEDAGLIEGTSDADGARTYAITRAGLARLWGEAGGPPS